MTALDWLTAPALPVWAALSSAHPRWGTDLRERWGFDVPPVQPGATWIVASSAGEARAGAALAAGLAPEPVLLTADTDQGAAVARGLVAVAGRKPVDHAFTLAPLWAEARPRRVVWVEGAYWPALDGLARRSGVPTVRVNARPGRGTARWLALGRRSALAVTREPGDVAWFEARGQRATWGGELKGEAPVGRNPLTWGRPFAVAACTREGDEARLLSGIDADLPWLIAPRQPERWDAVARLLEGRRWVRRSALTDGVVPEDVDLVLLDSLGELAACFDGARVAFVGGTFDPSVGGHAPVEAWRAGVPVVCGPETAVHAEAFAACGAVVARGDLRAAIREASGRRPPPAPTGAVARTVAALSPFQADCGEVSPRPWARPAAAAHRSARRVWHAAWDRGWRTPVRVDAPVVSVGSASARSPGRTPTVAWLCEELARRGHRPGVATRGYGRATGGLRGSWDTAEAADLGDEGALLAALGFPVAAAADRVAAANVLVARGVDVVVLDDGLQHRHLHRDLDLVVVDGRFPDARGELPMGEGREDAVPERVHGVVLHHGEALAGVSVPVAVATRAPGPWRLGHEVVPEGPQGPVAAFAGIGRPADFLASLPEVARFRSLADHQPVPEALAAELRAWAGDLPLVCTDKDHVRLPVALRATTWHRGVRLEVRGAPESWFGAGR